MNVQQLIDRLQCYPKEAKVMFDDDEIGQLWLKQRLDTDEKPIVYLEPKTVR